MKLCLEGGSRGSEIGVLHFYTRPVVRSDGCGLVLRFRMNNMREH
jgi:hypothetical protein